MKRLSMRERQFIGLLLVSAVFSAWGISAIAAKDKEQAQLQAHATRQEEAELGKFLRARSKLLLGAGSAAMGEIVKLGDLLRRRIALLSQVQALFHYWHVIHKPFAIIMYVIMGIHIGVALWTGYGWVR